jgi:hypothetical protein
MEVPMKIVWLVLFVTALVMGLSSAVHAQTDEAVPPELNMELPEEDTEGMAMPLGEEMMVPPDEMMPDEGSPPDEMPAEEMPPE